MNAANASALRAPRAARATRNRTGYGGFHGAIRSQLLAGFNAGVQTKTNMRNTLHCAAIVRRNGRAPSSSSRDQPMGTSNSTSSAKKRLIESARRRLATGMCAACPPPLATFSRPAIVLGTPPPSATTRSRSGHRDRPTSRDGASGDLTVAEKHLFVVGEIHGNKIQRRLRSGQRAAHLIPLPLVVVKTRPSPAPEASLGHHGNDRYADRAPLNRRKGVASHENGPACDSNVPDRRHACARWIVANGAEPCDVASMKRALSQARYRRLKPPL